MGLSSFFIKVISDWSFKGGQPANWIKFGYLQLKPAATYAKSHWKLVGVWKGNTWTEQAKYANYKHLLLVILQSTSYQLCSARWKVCSAKGPRQVIYNNPSPDQIHGWISHLAVHLPRDENNYSSIQTLCPKSCPAASFHFEGAVISSRNCFKQGQSTKHHKALDFDVSVILVMEFCWCDFGL